MWTKIVNFFGMQTKAQQIAAAERQAYRRRMARAAATRRRTIQKIDWRHNLIATGPDFYDYDYMEAAYGRPQAVITTDDVPVKKTNKGTVKRPPTSKTVRRGADTDWQVVGYTDSSPFSYGSGGGSSSYDSGSSSSGGSNGGGSSGSCD